MSSKRITINKILSNESLTQENQYFQVQGQEGWGGNTGGQEGTANKSVILAEAGLMGKVRGLGASSPERPQQAPAESAGRFCAKRGSRAQNREPRAASDMWSEHIPLKGRPKL